MKIPQIVTEEITSSSPWSMLPFSVIPIKIEHGDLSNAGPNRSRLEYKFDPSHDISALVAKYHEPLPNPHCNAHWYLMMTDQFFSA